MVEMTDAFRQPSLFYHLGVRESFSMANNIILYCDSNSDSLQSLQVSLPPQGAPCLDAEPPLTKKTLSQDSGEICDDDNSIQLQYMFLQIDIGLWFSAAKSSKLSLYV